MKYLAVCVSILLAQISYAATPVTPEFTNPDPEDYVKARKMVESWDKDESSRAMPDGLFVFADNELPQAFWDRIRKDAPKYGATIVVYGLKHETLMSVQKAVLGKAELLRDKDEDAQREIQQLILRDIPWANLDRVEIRPTWFALYKLDKVPAFVVKRGDDACVIRGDMSIRGAIQKLDELGCEPAHQWIQ